MALQSIETLSFYRINNSVLEVLHEQSIARAKYCITTASRNFKEYKNFGYFVKYSCTQEYITESSEINDQRKRKRN